MISLPVKGQRGNDFQSPNTFQCPSLNKHYTEKEATVSYDPNTAIAI